MKRINYKNDRHGVIFETKEELKIFCEFLYKNDYFIRKSYKELVEYKNYIEAHQKDLYLDNPYHERLVSELFETIDNYKRRTKLEHINEIAYE
jgi:hypothetical protein